MMESFNIKLNNFLNILYSKLLLLPIYEIIIITLLFLIAYFLRNIFSKFLINKIEKFTKLKIQNDMNFSYDSLQKPLKIIPFIFLIFFSTQIIDFGTNTQNIIFKLNLSLVTYLIFSIFLAFFNFYGKWLNQIEKKISSGFKNWIISSAKYIIIFLCIITILELWGIKVGPIIAGLGLFGVAIALGAQDLFKNLISGILLLLEKKFTIGDVVNIPSIGDGTVENIGFRSTTIRKFDSTLIVIPNYLLSDSHITNLSNRLYRRINWTIGIEYSSELDQLKNIVNQIQNYITNNSNDFIVSSDFKCLVRVDKFNDSSIDVLIYCFTNTCDWEKYLDIKQRLAYEIKKIIEVDNLCNFAFPSQSIYIENVKNNKHHNQS